MHYRSFEGVVTTPSQRGGEGKLKKFLLTRVAPDIRFRLTDIRLEKYCFKLKAEDK